MTNGADGTDGPAASGQSVKARVGRELREYAVTAGYLFVWLLALHLYTLGPGEAPSALHLGLAAGKALVLGKFVLLGEAVGVGTRVAAPTLGHRIAWRVVGLLGALILLTLVEEVVVGLVHGHTLVEAFSELANRPVRPGAGVLLMALVLAPFVAAKQLSLALGSGGLLGLLRSTPGR